jgi:glycosyltransferase involved in cell wall biosynthesis
VTPLRRIGLNALFLDPGVSGGSETYLRGLVPALLRALPQTRFEVATTRRGAPALAREDWAGEVKLLRLNCDDDEPLRRTLTEQAQLPRLARERGWELTHSLANRGPVRAGTVHVLTVLDVIFFHHRTMGLVSTYGMRWAVRAAAKRADALITISEAAADDIAATLGIERSRITAAPLGARAPAGGASPDAARERLGLAGARVVLCVAAKRPHKNQQLLVRALELLPQDVSLVIAGHDEGYGAHLTELADRLGVAERVRQLGYIPDAELETLWALADCAAFPTRAEGFGLPVLEAMRRGVPVVCSDIPVLREVAGDAARFFDPDEPAAAAAAITSALADPGAGDRGRERAAAFTWERTAQATAEVYERAASGR